MNKLGKALALVALVFTLVLQAVASTQITATLTITNAANITGTNGASLTVSNDLGTATRTFTNAVYSASTQVLAGTNAAQNQQRLLAQLAAYKINGVTVSSSSPTNVLLVASNDLALVVSLSPSTWGSVTYGTNTVGTATSVRVPLEVEPSASRSNIVNMLIDAVRRYGNSNAPGLYTRNLGVSNATVKPLHVQIVGNTNQIYSLEAGPNVTYSMTSTSIVASVGTNGFTVTGGTLTGSNATFTGTVKLADGINKRMGTNALENGTCLVTNATVTSASRILLTTLIGSGDVGTPYIHSITNGVSFTITNTSATDNSVVQWLIVDPAP